MNIQNNFTSIQQIQEQYLHNQSRTAVEKQEDNVSFAEVLKQKEALRFSKHADERLADRNITLTGEQMERLVQGTEKASEKGIRDSLVIMDNLTFIVNTKNRIVVTAMDCETQKENVYTNIDGAVIV